MPDGPSAVPVDRLHIVYIILLIHGIGSLLPWNMFITADAYFQMKLSPVNGTSNSSIGADDESASLKVYKDNFLSFVGIASKLPNTALQLANIIIPVTLISHKTRILISIMGQTLLFAETTAFAMTDTSLMIRSFYGLTMATVVIVNVFNGVFQSSFYGQVAQLPAKYMNAVVTGMNISGVVTSIFMIVSTASTPDLSASAVVYFSTAVAFLVISFVSYVYVMRTEFFTHFVEREKEEDKRTSDEDNKKERPPYLLILKQVWLHLFSIFFVYFVSLALFPAVLAGVISTTSLAGPYFAVVWCFLSFNTCAMLGNIAVDFWPKLIPEKRLWIFVVARLLFVPFFLFCNFKPDTRTVPVVFYNDAFYILGVMLFALTSGFMSSVAITMAPKSVAPEHASVAGMMASLTLMIGIATGISSSFLFANMV